MPLPGSVARPEEAPALRVYASMGGKADDGGSDTRALIRWINRNDLAAFSTRDIRRNLRRFRDNDAALADALAWLTSRNVIRPRPEADSAGRPGRKPTPTYEVNPALKTAPQNCQNCQNAPPEPHSVNSVNFAAPPIRETGPSDPHAMEGQSATGERGEQAPEPVSETTLPDGRTEIIL